MAEGKSVRMKLWLMRDRGFDSLVRIDKILA